MGNVSRATFHVEPLTVSGYVEATRGMQPWLSPHDEAERLMAAGPCWEAWVGGDVAAVGGLEILHPGVARAWATITATGRQHPTFVVRALARRLTASIRTRRLHRVQADVLVGYTAGYLLVDFLGFVEEGVMKGYGTDKADHVRYALVEGER